jgi:hypothetical protein
MLSRDHAVLLELFRSRSTSAMTLLRELAVELPDYDDIRIGSADLTEIVPTEYRADLVLFLESHSTKKLGVIIEVQLGRDENKQFSWPVYLANLRARHRCPVCLLVVAVKPSIARWAGKTIALGPGTRCRPHVIRPSSVPIVMELQQAIENIEMAMLSAIVHCQDADKSLAKRIVSTALEAARRIDAPRPNSCCAHWVEIGVARGLRTQSQQTATKITVETRSRPYCPPRRTSRVV